MLLNALVIILKQSKKEAPAPKSTDFKEAADHNDKEKVFWKKVLWSNRTKVKLFTHNG